MTGPSLTKSNRMHVALFTEYETSFTINTKSGYSYSNTST